MRAREAHVEHAADEDEVDGHECNEEQGDDGVESLLEPM